MRVQFGPLSIEEYFDMPCLRRFLDFFDSYLNDNSQWRMYIRGMALPSLPVASIFLDNRSAGN